jgi:hypothetical protein
MTRRASFRYLGDQEAQVVHDLDHEDEENCQIQSLLRSGRGITFRPDRLVEALRRGFQVCEHCIGQPPDDDASAGQEGVLREGAFRDRAHPATP